jgi:hypothetical protein
MKYGMGIEQSVSYKQFGFSGEYMIKPRIGLNYNLELMGRKDGLVQIHSSIGALAGPPLILFSVLTNNTIYGGSFGLGKPGVLLGIIILIAPDGVCYHFPIGYHWDVAPYANLLGVDFLRAPLEDHGRLKWSTSYGVKGTYWRANGFTINAFVETRQVVSLPWSIGAGLGIGYAFGKQEGQEDIEMDPQTTGKSTKNTVIF